MAAVGGRQNLYFPITDSEGDRNKKICAAYIWDEAFGIKEREVVSIYYTLDARHDYLIYERQTGYMRTADTDNPWFHTANDEAFAPVGTI